MARFAILLSGPVEPSRRLRVALAGRRGIAADGGIAHAATLGLSPELWVGDFDSATDADQAGFTIVERQSLPRDKDHTDGEAAILAAHARGADDFLLVGALRGPRSDHAFSNLVLSAGLSEAGHAVTLFDGREIAVPLRPSAITLDLPDGTPFSILKFSDVEGLTVSGARWPLDAVDLPFGAIVTQSNQALGPVTASLSAGRAILLANLATAEDYTPPRFTATDLVR